MFPVYCGKCLSRKEIHSWVEKCGKCFADDKEFEKRRYEMAETTVEDFYAADFDVLVKRWDKCIDVGGGYVEK
jgi:hypothetical protein